MGTPVGGSQQACQSSASALLGILYFVIGALSFTLIHALMKGLVDRYSFDLILFFRFAAAGLVALPIIAVGRCSLPRVGDLGRLALVAALCVVAMATVVKSLQYLPLGRATILFNTAPIIVLILAALMFRERVTWLHWLAVGLGLLGTLLVAADRGIGQVSIYDLWPLAAALAYALTLLCLRRMALDMSSLAASIQVNLAILVLLLPGGLIRWVVPTLDDLPSIVALGILTWLSEWLTLLGLSRVNTATIAPFDYLSIVFALIIGYLVWFEIPSYVSLVGACVITSAGLLALRLRGA